MINITKLKVDEETGEISMYELTWRDFFETKEEGEKAWNEFKMKQLEEWQNDEK